jgi:SecD/SecF fusion protein
MNRSHLWKFLFVLFTVFWATTEILPYKNRNLVEQFDRTARLNPDKVLADIVAKARDLEKANKQDQTSISYTNLLSAIGTNDIRRYFPTNYILPGASTLPVTQQVLNRVQRESAGRFKLGIDLKGGTSFLLELDTTKVATATNTPSGTNAPTEESFLSRRGDSTLVEQAMSVLRKRVDALGVAEPIIQPAGEKSILVQLPGLTEADKENARQQLRRAAFLEFRMLDPRMQEHLASGIIPPGYERKGIVIKDKKTGRQSVEPVIIKKTPEQGLTGEYIRSTDVSLNPMTGEPIILFSLTSDGARIFADVTTKMVGQRLGIVLDGEVISAPNIQTPITGGSGQITGNFDQKEAIDLASALDNPLKVPLRIIDERGVDPSLGADSVASGIKAAVYGVIAVAAFMLAYYLFAGVVANIALLLNVLLLLGVMCSLDVTYTLPGIAGSV